MKGSTMKALSVSAKWDPRPEYRLSDYEKRTQISMNGNATWRDPVWELSERPVPQIDAPDEILVKVKACGVCGSDLHMYETDADGYMLLAYRSRFPCVMGHEFSGEVVEVGSGVSKFAVGDFVTSEEINYCGECRACKFGLFNQCVDALDIGFTVDGAFAEYIVLKERFCWSLNGLRGRYDDEKVFEIGAICEPTSVAYEAVFTRTGGFAPGGDVAVFGCGPIGLAATALARAAGAARVIAVDSLPARRDLAVSLGADVALDPAELASAGTSVGQEIMDITQGNGVALAVEASGAYEKVMPEIEDCIDYGGKVSVVGIDAAAAPVTFSKYIVRAGSLYASLGHCGADFGYVIGLHEAGRIDMTAMVTGRFALNDGMSAIKKTQERIDAKVLIKP